MVLVRFRSLIFLFCFVALPSFAKAEDYLLGDDALSSLDRQIETKQKEDEKPLTKQMMDENFTRVAEQMGIPETSRLYKPMHAIWLRQAKDHEPTKKEIDAQEEREAISGNLTDDKSLLPFDQDLAILVHYRGSLGELIPTKEQVWNPRELLPPEEIRRQLEAMEPEILKTEMDLAKARPIERCAESKTVKERLPGAAHGPKDKEKKVMLDLLFMNKDDIPREPDEAFGREVEMRPYEAGSLEPTSIYIDKVGTKCLPYRLRITRDFQIQDYGLNAMFNYDDDPFGKGKLSPLMTKKILDMGYVFRGK